MGLSTNANDYSPHNFPPMESIYIEILLQSGVKSLKLASMYLCMTSALGPHTVLEITTISLGGLVAKWLLCCVTNPNTEWEFVHFVEPL